MPTHPFLRYVLANVESSIVSANEMWMRRYAGLVPDPEVRTHFLNIIIGEFHRTQAVIANLFQGSFEERRPRMAFTLAIREQPLTVLHEQQLDLLVSVNAVASGLRTAG